MYIFDKQSIIFHVIRICTCVHEAGENKIPAYKQIHETESSRKERNSNLELYRIIVMLLIVAHHYVVNSGLMSVMKEEPLHIQSIFLYLFGMWGKTGINCFVMITGYFMCKSHISLRKFMKLLFEIYFYNLIITGTFLLTGYCSPSFSTVFYALVPIQSFGVNFVACFVVFYLLIPFLNLLIQTMNSKLHLRLILLCLLVYSVIGTIPKITLGVNYVSWFVVLYFIASYIRLYRFPIKISNLKSATKLFSVLLASKRPLITELADKLRLKYPLLPTISPCPTMRLEAIRSIIPISCRRYPKSV